jgi:divalent metal cation (Fe/Co/Zn/Cd) transporter
MKTVRILESKPMREKRSTGELISSVAFFLCGIFLISEGMNTLSADFNWKGIVILAGGCMSALAAFRFSIQRFVEKLRSK